MRPPAGASASIFADGDTTQSVAGANIFETADTTAPTTITALDDAGSARPQIIVTDALTTFQDGGTLRLRGNLVGTPDATLTLTTPDGLSWFEVTRSAN